MSAEDRHPFSPTMLADTIVEAMDQSTDKLASKVGEAVKISLTDFLKEEERKQKNTLQVRESSSDTHRLKPSVRIESPGTFHGHGIGTAARRMTMLRTPRASIGGGILPRSCLAPGKVDISMEQLDEGFACREYDFQVPVEIKMTFLRINDIDTLSQQFEAEVYVQAKWEEKSYAGTNSKELDGLLPGDLWDPQLIVLNIAGEPDQERRSYVVRYEDGYEAPVVLHRWRFKGLFRKVLELQHFPFDVQDLTVQMSTERSREEILMIHDKHQLSAVNTKTFQDAQEWSIYKHVECGQRFTSVDFASSDVHPILWFSCRVRRRVGYFVWNIVFIVFLVLVLSLLSVSIEPTSSDRLASTMTLFLTMVAFKLVVKQSLPTISYLTYLDIYVLGSLMYLVLYALENSAMNSMGRWMDHDLVEAYDEFFAMLLLTLLIVFHLCFIIHIQVTALRRHREMTEADRNYVLEARRLADKHDIDRKKPPNNNVKTSSSTGSKQVPH